MRNLLYNLQGKTANPELCFGPESNGPDFGIFENRILLTVQVDPRISNRQWLILYIYIPPLFREFLHTHTQKKKKKKKGDCSEIAQGPLRIRGVMYF